MTHNLSNYRYYVYGTMYATMKTQSVPFFLPKGVLFELLELIFRFLQQNVELLFH